jgi:hypothetical protein
VILAVYFRLGSVNAAALQRSGFAWVLAAPVDCSGVVVVDSALVAKASDRFPRTVHDCRQVWSVI